jgi:ABC-type sugar transport system ATPase subunit
VDNPPPVVRVRSVTKRYGGLVALDDVSFDVRPGEVLGLVGDNGAGKSTMLKILSGVIAPTEGSIEINGQPVSFTSPLDASRAGISTVYQDLALAPQRTVVDNFFLGRELVVPNLFGRLFGWLDQARMKRITRERLMELRVKIKDLDAACRDLSGGQRQALAIARAAAWCEGVLLLDEPTSALGVEQHHEVLQLVKDTREAGRSVVLVSHQMPDILEVCDRIVVFRLGKVAAVADRADMSAERLVSYITGAASMEAPTPAAAGADR